MAFRPTDPATARAIADQTVQALADLKRSLTLEQLHSRHREWIAFADAFRVVPQIREHVRDEVRNLSVALKAKRIVRDPTGEPA